MHPYKTPAKKKTKRTRKIKSLPELAGLKDCATDWEKFTIAKEADSNNKSKQFGKELSAVQSVCIMIDGKESVFDLHLLNVNQLWQLCKNVGVITCGNSTKYWCCALIANYFA
jgi:hypothetical protein